MKPGDWTLLPFPAANRDPEMFERADEVLIDREQNRHAAFGLGIHRCIGSNLARLELTIAVQEFVREFPEYSVEGEVVWSLGQVRGPRELPIKIG
jgi:cytochrome P450